MAFTKHPAPSWAIGQVIRGSGLVEDTCIHGVGHPNATYLKKHPEANAVHGCDGCCGGSISFKNEQKEKHTTVKKEKVKYDSREPSYEATFNFLQDGDTCQTECMQKLKVEVVSSGTGHFLRITTGTTGWSIDEPEALMSLLKLVARVQSDNDQISGVKDAHNLS